ncbi:MAG: hypothetical protein ACXU8O_08570, partial [Asticcacaulis sp.]
MAATLAATLGAAARAQTQAYNPNIEPSRPSASAGVEAANVATATREVSGTGQSDHLGAGLRKPDSKLTFKGRIATGIPGLDRTFQKTVDLKDLLKTHGHKGQASVAPAAGALSGAAVSSHRPNPGPQHVSAAPVAARAAASSAPLVPAVSVTPRVAAASGQPAPQPRAPAPNIVGKIAMAVAAAGVIGAAIAALFHAAVAEALSHLIHRIRPPRIHAEVRMGE